METDQYLSAIRDESARLVAAGLSAGLDAPVPSCPEWDVADLFGHLGRVQRWAADAVSRRLQEPERRFEDPPADADARTEWARDGTVLLVDALGATPPDAPMWTFTGPGTAAFWFRRQAHEAAMHRVDAELATGVAPVIDAELGRDGLDEFFGVVVVARLRERFVGTGETVHLHCTDGEGEWLVRLTADGPEVERAHAKGDVAARGTASDLLLLVRGRVGIDAVEVFGDATLLERFVELARI